MLGSKNKSQTEWRHRTGLEARLGNVPPRSYIRQLRLFEHWQTVRHMYRNYPGVDTNFDAVLRGRFRRPFLRWIGMPLYFWSVNRGYGLWLDEGELAGEIYLQHRRLVTHINDIEVNQGFQGRGLSHILLALAEQQARKRGKSFLTLAVTLTNTRAVSLYRKSGFADQHRHYLYLSRPWWSESSSTNNQLPPPHSSVRLEPLSRLAAGRNLRRFFSQEIRAGEPLTSQVWEALYPPRLPRRDEGFSFALYVGDRIVPQGHADFFDSDGRGRWRIYLDPALWGSQAERALFEAMLYQSRGYNGLGLMVGTLPHHTAALTLASNLGLVERETERMLMVKSLKTES